MPNTSTNKKFALLLMLSIGLTSVTGILGAPFLRAIHLAYGGFKYWFVLFAVSASLWATGFVPVALSFLVLVIAVGVYREFEGAKKSWLISGFFSLLAALITALLGVWLWTYQEGWVLSEQVREVVQGYLSQAGLATDSEAFDLDAIITQIPSVLAIFIVVSLALSLIYEKRMMNWFQLGATKSSQVIQLKSFRMPDGFIWLTMVAFLLTMVNLGVESLTVLGANVFNVMVVLFLFQGLAIFESIFQHYGVAPLWRLLIYLILILQLFFFLSLIGFVDFWVGFRERFIRNKIEQN